MSTAPLGGAAPAGSDPMNRPGLSLGRERGEPGSTTSLRRVDRGTALGLGVTVLWLSLLVLIPLGAVAWRAGENGLSGFWDAVTTPEAWSSIKLTVIASAIVALVNVVMGTLI